jgi:hypothetical protein
MIQPLLHPTGPTSEPAINTSPPQSPTSPIESDYGAQYPPSTLISAPVVYDAASDAK